MLTPRETQRSTNTLVCLLQGLAGHVVKIELRNEASILGRIVYVNGYMDVDMVNVSYTDIDDNKTSIFEDFHIQGKNIRFVQVPDELNMLSVISRQLEMNCRPSKLARVEPRVPFRKGKKGALARAKKDPETKRKERAIRKGLRQARLQKKVAETKAALARQDNPESSTATVSTFQKNTEKTDGGSETEPAKNKSDA